MRKMSRLQTWERAILYIAARGVIFSVNYCYQNLRTVYSDIRLVDVIRATRALLELGYLDISVGNDPFFSNRTSYVCSAAGHEYQGYCDRIQALLEGLILKMLP